MPARPGDLPLPRFAPAGGDGAPAGTTPHHRKVRALTEGDTGLLFEPLILFAEPLFELYDLDPAEAFALREDPAAADEGLAAVLEAARLLWAYYALPPEDQARRYPTMAAFLLGPEHTPEDEADLELVLKRMEAQWALLTPEDRAVAESAAAPTLGFDALLTHPAFALPADAPSSTAAYGPEGLSELEAQALFAQPLIDAAADPDQMEAALERASAYWDLAHHHGDAREALRQELVRTFAPTPAGRARVEEEAEAMLRRFESLFPERRA